VTGAEVPGVTTEQAGLPPGAVRVRFGPKGQRIERGVFLRLADRVGDSTNPVASEHGQVVEVLSVDAFGFDRPSGHPAFAVGHDRDAADALRIGAHTD
jgi:hypothetical protein